MEPRGFLASVWRWRWLILAATLVPAGVALAVSLSQPTLYQATTLMATHLPNLHVDLHLEIGTPAVLATEIPSGQELPADAAESYRRGVASIACSTELAERVLPQFAAELEQLDSRLVQGEMFLATRATCLLRPDTDLLALTISLEDPNLAAQVANAWAAVLVEYVSDFYSVSGSGLLQQVQDQHDQARLAYEEAERDLEAYLAESDIRNLELEADAIRAQLQGYEAAIVQLASGTAEQAAELETARTDLAALMRLLDSARILRQHVAQGEASGPEAWGNYVGFLILRAMAYAPAEQSLPEAGEEGTPPVSGQLASVVIQLGGEPEEVPLTVADVDALVALLEARILETQTRVDSLMALLSEDVAGQPTSPVDPAVRSVVEELAAQLQSLEAQLEAENARGEELTLLRDTAWEDYAAFSRALAEVELAGQARPVLVRVVSVAGVPAEPVGPSTARKVIEAGVAGLMVGAGLAFFAEYFARYLSVKRPRKGEARER